MLALLCEERCCRHLPMSKYTPRPSVKDTPAFWTVKPCSTLAFQPGLSCDLPSVARRLHPVFDGTASLRRVNPVGSKLRLLPNTVSTPVQVQSLLHLETTILTTHQQQLHLHGRWAPRHQQMTPQLPCSSSYNLAQATTPQ